MMRTRALARLYSSVQAYSSLSLENLLSIFNCFAFLFRFTTNLFRLNILFAASYCDFNLQFEMF